MKYGTYNDELGYANGPEFDNAFDAVCAAAGKCRQHSVLVYNEDGSFHRRLSNAEAIEIYEKGAAAAPADKVQYCFPALIPLALPKNENANWEKVLPFKAVAEQNNIPFGGYSGKVGCCFVTLEKEQGGGFFIAVYVDYSLPQSVRAQFDTLARYQHCPLVIERNAYYKIKSQKFYK